LDDLVLLPETSADLLVRNSSLSTTMALSTSPSRISAQISPLLSPEKEMKIIDGSKYSGQLIAMIYKQVGLLDAHLPIIKYSPSNF